MKRIFISLSLVALSVASVFGADDGYRRTWDFRNGYSASTLEIMAQDTEHWTVQGTGYQNTANFSEFKAVMNYNGETIPVPELEGLELGGLKSAAHVQIWDGKSNNQSFPANTACLWINGKKNVDYISFTVPAGENVKIGYCSHSASEERGFKVSEGFADAEGNTTFKSKADATIKEVELINSNAGESTLKLTSTNGHHIYYIIIGEGDVAASYNAGYLYSGETAMESLPLYTVLKEMPNVTWNPIKLEDGVPTKDALMAYDAVVLDATLPADNADLNAALKENMYWQPVVNFNGKLAEALGYGKAVESEHELGWVYDVKDAVFADFEGYSDSVMYVLSNGEPMPTALAEITQSNIDKLVVMCDDDEAYPYADSVFSYVYNSGHNQYAYYGAGEDFGYGTDVIIRNLVSKTLSSKTEVTATPKPAFSGDYKEMESVITLSCLSKNATIYYTVDGSEPTLSSQVYTEPVVVTTENVTIKAIAIADGYLVSEVNSFDVLLYHQAKTPVISYEGDGKTENAVVTITSPEEGVDIWYNFTASEDTLASTKYDGPITLPISATISAFAVSESLGLVASELVSQQVLANVDNIRRDELAHFRVSNSGWNTLENLTLDGEPMAAWVNSNYYFSWGKTATSSYEQGEPKLDADGNPIMDEEGNIIYETTEKAQSVTLNSADPDWRLVSCGQVMVYQGNTLGTLIGNGDGYNPARAEDLYESLGTTGCIQFANVAAGDKNTAAIESTKKFAGPFNVVTIVANVASGGRVAVEVSKDGETWEQVGDTLQTSTVKRLYKKFEVAYEGSDEVYVRVASIEKVSQSVHDIYVFNHGEKSEAMKNELTNSIKDIVAPETVVAKPVKMIKDGQLVIVVGNAVYSVTGARLK